MNATPIERPEVEEVTHDSLQVIHAVERVLAMCLPEHPNDYWPTKPDEYRGTGSEGALDGSTFSLFEYRNISRRLSRHADTDAERLAIDPAYRQHAILDAYPQSRIGKLLSVGRHAESVPRASHPLAGWCELHAFSAGEEL